MGAGVFSGVVGFSAVGADKHGRGDIEVEAKERDLIGMILEKLGRVHAEAMSDQKTAQGRMGDPKNLNVSKDLSDASDIAHTELDLDHE